MGQRVGLAGRWERAALITRAEETAGSMIEGTPGGGGEPVTSRLSPFLTESLSGRSILPARGRRGVGGKRHGPPAPCRFRSSILGMVGDEPRG